MKSLQQMLILLSLVFASCQCATAADYTTSYDVVAEDCHDAPAIDVDDCDGCDLDATLTSAEAKKFPIQIAILAQEPAFVSAQPQRENAGAVDLRRGPPEPSTPTTRFDCLLN